VLVQGVSKREILRETGMHWTTLEKILTHSSPPGYQAIGSACSKDNADYATYLLRLTERELIERQSRAADRRIKAAGFPVIKTMDTFDFKVQPSINEALVKELLRGDYIDRHENILLIGNSGTGKSHLATALSFAVCAAGKKVRFYSVTNLVTQLLEKREERSLERFQKQLKKTRPAGAR
jgi:DNA replication protein DnaC